MPFTAPLALLGLIFLPLVVAMYLLKLRRTETIVPSTLLWQRLVADIEANAPWQRLRRSLLLLLQLLLVILLAILAAQPFLERPAGLARDIVMVVDASASMATTDITPSRMVAAQDKAIAALSDLPSGGSVSVIAAGRSARVVANGTTDMSRIRAAIRSIEAEASAGSMADALQLASGLARRSADAEVVVVTDGALAQTPHVQVGAPIRVLTVGRDRKNQAIVALAVRTAPSGVTRSAFISVANFDLAQAKRRLQLWGDGHLIEARDVYVDPQARANIGIDDIQPGIAVLEARLLADDDDADVAAAAGSADQLTIDDRAWAVMPPDRLHRVLLVSDGDPYLQTALSYLPNAELYGVKPSEYGPATRPRDGSDWDLIVFDAALPATLPARPILAIAPPRTSDLGTVTGKLTNPPIGSVDPAEPALRYVDLSTVHVAEATKLELPAWARQVIPGPSGTPLLYAGTRAGLATAVLAFEPRRSDLPLQVGFPILIANLAGELMGGNDAPTEALRPGTPVVLAIPDGATGLTVEKPDGTALDLVPGTAGATNVTFAGTDQLGVYTVRPKGLPDPSASPGASGSVAPSGAAPSAAAPSATATPSSSAQPSASPRTAPPLDPAAPIRFAVDLFDVDESNIAPGDGAGLVQLGGATASASPGTSPGASATAGPSSSPAASGQTGAGSNAGDRPPARDQLWVPILLIVLAVLAVEWAVYERDALARIRRGLLGRFRARRPTSGPAAPPGTTR